MAWYGQGILTIKTGVSSQRSLELMSLCEYKVRMWAIMGLMMFYMLLFYTSESEYGSIEKGRYPNPLGSMGLIYWPT